MKKFKLILFSLALAFTSCEDAIDNIRSLQASQATEIYTDIELTTALASYTYNSTESWALNTSVWWTRRINIEGCSDEAWFHWPSRTNLRIQYDAMDPSNAGLGWWAQKWGEYYRYVASANKFLEDIQGKPVLDSDPVAAKTLIAEIKFLRANTYARLINLFGGVPLIKKPLPFSTDTSIYDIPRDSYQDCVEFIVSELDEAIAMFPADMIRRSGDDFGRADIGSCMALKSRVLLYAASDIHDPAKAPQTTNRDLYIYDKATKWQEAADAAKAVIDLGVYSFEQVNSWEEYQAMFIDNNSELIFARPVHKDWFNNPNDPNTTPDKAHGPVGDDGWGLSNPTQNFVDDFKMVDGKRPTDAGSGWTRANQYDNREMRFYASVFYQGSKSRADRDIEYWSPDGADSKDLPGAAGRHWAKTGYNVRKFQDMGLSDVNTQQSAKRPVPLIRLAEMYLNYAEAMYRLGNEGEARTYASFTAQRVGLPAITSSGADLMEDIKYERQMELFWEGHRFFDLRRWMMEAKMNEDIIGVQWERKDSNGNLEGDRDKPATVQMIGPNLIDERSFTVKSYYLPIPLVEQQRAPSLIQNFGYLD